jgi:hypothetical protein
LLEASSAVFLRNEGKPFPTSEAISVGPCAAPKQEILAAQGAVRGILSYFDILDARIQLKSATIPKMTTGEFGELSMLSGHSTASSSSFPNNAQDHTAASFFVA